MEMTKKGNYKLEDWSLKGIECTGVTLWNKPKHRPCHSIFTLHDGDIVKYLPYDDPNDTEYGFICSQCGNFTEISPNLIPYEIKEWCPQIAEPDSAAYSKLSPKEKELSKYL